MSDRPLTDLQERVLAALAETGSGYVDAMMVSRALIREAEVARNEEEWERWRKTENPTLGRVLAALHKHGLVDRQWSALDAAWRWKVNDEGRAMLASMGD